MVEISARAGFYRFVVRVLILAHSDDGTSQAFCLAALSCYR